MKLLTRAGPPCTNAVLLRALGHPAPTLFFSQRYQSGMIRFCSHFRPCSRPFDNLHRLQQKDVETATRLWMQNSSHILLANRDFSPPFAFLMRRRASPSSWSSSAMARTLTPSAGLLAPPVSLGGPPRSARSAARSLRIGLAEGRAHHCGMRVGSAQVSISHLHDHTSHTLGPLDPHNSATVESTVSACGKPSWTHIWCIRPPP